MPKHNTSSLQRIACALLLVIGLLFAISAAQADGFTGKVDLIEAKSDGTRFFVRVPGLNLYASGHYHDVLLQGFFRKASFSISYQPFPCPGGLSGKCGTVYSVAVEQANF
jgi:hypothetical protein